jgi:hypothetical protein
MQYFAKSVSLQLIDLKNERHHFFSQIYQAVYVEIEPEKTEAFKEKWRSLFPEIELVVLPSPYRSLLHPVLNFIDAIEKEHPDKKVTVIIGEFASDKWWHPLLHGHRTTSKSGAIIQAGSNSDQRAIRSQVKARVRSLKRAGVKRLNGGRHFAVMPPWCLSSVNWVLSIS